MSHDAVLAVAWRLDLWVPAANGIVLGSVYGLIALGLVLVYKGNRIFNFAAGEFATVAGLMAWAFWSGQGIFPKVPFWLACLIGVLSGGVVALVTERLVVRALFRQPRVTLVVATAGVALLLIGAELLWLGANPNVFRPVVQGIPFTLFGKSSDPASFKVLWQYVVVVGVLVVLALVMAVFFRTRYGLGILAVSQDPTAASAVGISVSRISMLTWGIAGLLAGIAGVLLAGMPGTIIAPAFVTQGTGTLIPAFTAAVLGGMTSLPGAFVGGLALGVIQQLALDIPSSTLPGADYVVVMAVLLLVLLVRPTGLLGRET